MMKKLQNKKFRVSINLGFGKVKFVITNASFNDIRTFAIAIHITK